MPRTRDLINVELLMTRRDVKTVLVGEGVAATTVDKYFHVPGFPLPPTTRAGVINWLTYRRAHAHDASRRKRGRPWSVGERAYYLRRGHIQTKTIAKMLGVSQRWVMRSLRQFRLRTGRTGGLGDSNTRREE